MNWDRLEGQWKQQRGRAGYHWGKIMNDDLAAILGKYEELVGKLQEKYGISKDEARDQANDYKIIVAQLQRDSRKLLKVQKAISTKRHRH